MKMTNNFINHNKYKNIYGLRMLSQIDDCVKVKEGELNRVIRGHINSTYEKVNFGPTTANISLVLYL